MTAKTLKVLLVEDDEDDYVLTRDLLAEIDLHKLELSWVATYPAALEAIEKDEPDLCLIDYRLGAHNGVELLHELKARGYRIPAILLTGQEDYGVDVEAMTAGAADYLVKGQINKSLLERAIRYTLERAETFAALRASENKYRQIVETALESIWLLDRDARTSYVNRRMAELLGYDVTEMLTRPMFDFLADAARPLAKRGFEVRKAGMAEPLEFRFRRRDGTDLWALVSINSLYDADGEFSGALALISDITARKRAEDALRESEARLFRFLDALPLGVFVVDAAGRPHYANNEAQQILGKGVILNARRDDMAEVYQAFVAGTEQLYPAQKMPILRALSGEHAMVEDMEIHHPDRIVPLQVSAAPIYGGSGEIDFAIAAFSDITQRRLAEQQIKRSNQELRCLSARLQSVREEESIRIAREIHDDLGGALTGLKMDVVWLGKQIPEAGNEAIRQKLQAMSGHIDESVQQVRNIATELRPSVLDDLGLFTAIEWQAREFQRRTEIKCTITSLPPEETLSPQKSTGVFRILQEILTNVARHAHATLVGIGIEAHGDKLILKVSDNGSGIRQCEISASKSLGLLGMRERAKLFGGQLDIAGVAGTGTVVTVTIPRESLQVSQRHKEEQ